MALNINTNVASLNAPQMNRSIEGSDGSMNRLSTGLRIHTAKDDATGLTISDANIKALHSVQANPNDAFKINISKHSLEKVDSVGNNVKDANNGISLLQTAEGAIGEQSTILDRVRELAVQASSGSLTSADRSNYQEEVKQLTDEINRISESTEFNGQKLLTGDFKENIAGVNISISSLSGGKGTDLSNFDLSSQEASQATIESVDKLIEQLSDTRGSLGSAMHQIEQNTSNLFTNSIENASWGLRDVDYASESSNFSKLNILQQAGSYALAQANQNPTMALSLLS